VRRHCIGALLCGALLWAPGSPGAQAGSSPRGLVLSFTAPDGCPSPAALRELVSEHLGHAGERGPALRVQVVVRRAGIERWVARLEVRGAAGGRRDLEGASCREVIDAAALVIALAVEEEGHVAQQPLPMVLEGEPELGGAGAIDSERGPAERAPPARPPARLALRSPEPPEPGAPVREAPDYDFDLAQRREESGEVEHRHTRLAARAGGAGASGMLPRVTPGFDLAISAWRDRNGVELATSFWAASQARADLGPAGARVRMWAAGLRGCRGFAAWFACAGGEVGRMVGRGMAVRNPREAGALWAAMSASVWFRRHLAGQAAIYAGFEGLVPVTRPRFQMDDETLLYQPGPVAARLLIGLELSTR